MISDDDIETQAVKLADSLDLKSFLAVSKRTEELIRDRDRATRLTALPQDERERLNRLAAHPKSEQLPEYWLVWAGCSADKACDAAANARALAASDEWLAGRKEAGLKIDSETALIHWHWADVCDPYGLLPEQQKSGCIGREYFARSPDSDDWVNFGDLPKATADALWKRLRPGHDDRPF